MPGRHAGGGNWRQHVSVYSEPLDHESIASRLEGASRVMVLTCPYCASLSLAYSRDIPVYTLNRHFTWSNGIAEEARLLAEVLESEGKTVEVFGQSFLASSPFCTLGHIRKWQLRRKCRGFDAVVVLACVGGLVGVSQTLKGTAKIVHGMRSLGCGTFNLRLQRPFGIVVDRETARVSRFSSASGECEPPEE